MQGLENRKRMQESQTGSQTSNGVEYREGMCSALAGDSL